MFIVALFTIVKTWKQQKCPLTDDWTKKTKYIYRCVYVYIYIYIHTQKYIYNGILLSQ